MILQHTNCLFYPAKHKRRRNVREQRHGKQHKIRHAGEQWTRRLERVHDGLSKVSMRSAFFDALGELRGASHRGTGRNSE